jgi:hypothetical protein
MTVTHEKYKGIKNPHSWDVPGIEIPAPQSCTSQQGTNSAGENPVKEKKHETQILDIGASYGCCSACFDDDSKCLGTVRVANESSETSKLEQFAYWWFSPYAGSVPEVE